MTTIKRIARMAQEMTSEEFSMLVELRKVLIAAGTTATPKRRRRKKTAKAVAAVKVERKTAKANGGDVGAQPAKRGPGRPRKVQSMLPVEPSAQA